MKFIEVSGTVVGSETWSQTHVSGKSTGVSVGGFGTSSGRTTSTVTNVAQLWVQTDDGREVAVRTNPDKFATRGGHRVSMALLVRNSGPGWMVAGYNHTTGDKRREGVVGLYFLAIVGFIFTFWMPLIFFGFGAAVGLIACGLYLWAIGSLVVTAVRIGAAGSNFLSRLSQHAHPTGLAPVAGAT